MSEEVLLADRAGDMARMAALLEARVGEWPPVDGEWDRDAIGFFLAELGTERLDLRWGPRYVTVDGELVATTGFLGGPDPHGEVEIGYSVCASHRRRGIATAIIGQLVGHAAANGCTSVRARTTGSNVGSVKALTANGFAVVERTPLGDDDELVLRVRLDRRHHR